MDNETLDKLMSESQYHTIKMTDKKGNTVEGYVGLYESEYDSGKGEPCIGISMSSKIYGQNLWYLSEIEELTILYKGKKK